MEYDPGDIDELVGNGFGIDPNPGSPVDHGSLSQGRPGRVEKERADAFRDQIAEEMWTAYQAVLQERGQEGLDDYLDVDNNGDSH